MIDAGLVTVGGAPARVASRQVAPAESVVVAGEPPRFVSRGGEKLDAALDAWAIDVRGRRSVAQPLASAPAESAINPAHQRMKRRRASGIAPFLLTAASRFHALSWARAPRRQIVFR